MVLSTRGTRLAAAVVGAGFISSGCGGESAEEMWAADACSAITSWQQEVDRTVVMPVEQLRAADGQGPSVAIIRAVRKMGQRTEDLRAEFVRLDAAMLDQQASTVLVGLLEGAADYLDQLEASVKGDLEALPSAPTVREIAKLLSDAKLGLANGHAQVSGAIHTLAVAVPDLEPTFADPEACSELYESPS